MSNLLPCPFCGYESPLLFQAENYNWFVRCKCSAEGPVGSLVSDAEISWNDRAFFGSTTQQAAAAVLAAQEAKGLSKYGTTLDTANLSLLEIAQHYQQEAADALMYATAMVELMKKEAQS